MEEKKKNNSPKPKFNAYWIYGVIITLLLGMSMFGGDNSFQSLNKTNISEFERFLNDGDVSEIIVINKNLAQITLTNEALEKQVHERVKTKNFWLMKISLNNLSHKHISEPKRRLILSRIQTY